MKINKIWCKSDIVCQMAKFGSTVLSFSSSLFELVYFLSYSLIVPGIRFLLTSLLLLLMSSNELIQGQNLSSLWKLTVIHFSTLGHKTINIGACRNFIIATYRKDSF